MKNYYEILGVEPDATPEQIKAAYKTLAQKMHPDKGGDELEFVWLNEAHDVLSDPERREQYDLTGDGDKLDINALAKQVIVHLFMSVIDDALMGQKPELAYQTIIMGRRSDTPLIKEMHTKLVNRNRELKTGMKAVKAQLKKLDKIKAGIKFKADGPDELLQALFDGKHKTLKKQQHSLETEKIINEQALRLLDNYEDIVAGAKEHLDFSTVTKAVNYMSMNDV